jgi:misacylated tRNA(Ala) deacylase
VPTELLYLTDAYVREFEARVVAVDPLARAVALTSTAFYPGGGGQPADIGLLTFGATAVAVAAVGRDGDGRVWHTLPAETPLPRVGTPVVGLLDWRRRHLLMRTHMALHLVNAVVWLDHGARVTGAHMSPGAGRVDLELGAISKQFGHELERRVNRYVAGDLPIRTVFVARREADANPAVFRSRADRVAPDVDPVRVVEVQGLDRQACSGTHVASTREIGPIRVTKTESKGKHNKRVRIALTARPAEPVHADVHPR